MCLYIRMSHLFSLKYGGQGDIPDTAASVRSELGVGTVATPGRAPLTVIPDLVKTFTMMGVSPTILNFFEERTKHGKI